MAEQTLYDELEEDEANFRNQRRAKARGQICEAARRNIRGTQSEGTRAPDNLRRTGIQDGREGYYLFLETLSFPGGFNPGQKACGRNQVFFTASVMAKGMQAFALDKKAWLEDEEPGQS